MHLACIDINVTNKCFYEWLLQTQMIFFIVLNVGACKYLFQFISMWQNSQIVHSSQLILYLPSFCMLPIFNEHVHDYPAIPKT